MKVLMLSWEYPPKSVGGLAQHVYDLTNAYPAQGVEVHLITAGEKGPRLLKK
ncbi:MAG: glycogen/starch synthase [Candidatus Syntrophopropionicum ammoniitolerans]